jgi:hypothetical protein
MNINAAEAIVHRFFTFGCSFTQYWRWPTWADLLGRQYPFYENWGLCGAGNAYIFYSLIECHQRHHISSSDTVYVMWTNTSREDRYVGDRWLEGGNVYWGNHPLGPDYLRHYACERGFLIRDLALIEAARQLLQIWQCEWRFFSMVPLERTNQANDLGDNPSRATQPDQDVRDFYRDTLATIGPSVLDTVFRGKWFTGDGIPDDYDARRRDFHPTPREHAIYLERAAPDISIPASDLDWMLQCDHDAREGRLRWQQPNRPPGRL